MPQTAGEQTSLRIKRAILSMITCFCILEFSLILPGTIRRLSLSTDTEEAIEDLTRALELAPDNPDACYQRRLTCVPQERMEQEDEGN
jgi:hypothetical protein